MRLKTLLITVALFVVSMSSYGQLLQWNTFGNAGTETTEPSVFNDTNISASNLTLGTGVTGAGNTNRLGGNNWFDDVDTNPTTLAESITGNDYIQFVVTPNSGYSFTPTSFVFSWDRSGTGPTSVTLRSSVDGYVTNLGTITGMAGAISTGNTITISGLTNITTATTFRIYGYGATASTGTGGFDVASSVVNVQLNGTTALIGPSSITSGDWNVGSTWSTGSVPTNADNVTIATTHTVFTSTALTRTGTTTVNGSFQLNAGGYASGTNFTYGAAGTLIFNQLSGGSYGVSNTDVFWPATSGPFNVTNSGQGVTMNSMARTVAGTYTTSAPLTNTSNLTVNGTCQINSTSGTFDSALTYGPSASLVYNVNATMGRGNEWNTSNPANVTLQNNSVLNYPNGWGTFTRTITGNLTINSGSALYMDYGSPASGVGLLTIGENATISGNLSLGNQAGGDIAVGGNWTNSGTFTPNGRAVTFNGTGTQTITNASGETFNYLINNKTAGSLTLANNVTVNGTTGSVLQLLNAGGFDLNGKSLTLSGAGGDIQVTDGARTITSSTAATITITGNKTVSGTGTLILDTNITTLLGAIIDFGSSKTTINGVLQINSGFVSTNSPIYGNASTLKYNFNGTFGRTYEWFALGVGTINVTPGYPNNVQISNNTTLDYLATTTNAAVGSKAMAGNLTIDSGSTLNMNYNTVPHIAAGGALVVAGNVSNAGTLTLGYAVGDDLKIGGDFTNTGTFNGNNRAVFFTRSSTGTQLITATSGITIPYIVIQPASGTDTVQLSSGTNLTISAPLAGIALTFTNATDVFDINSNTLTIGTTGIDNTITGSGTFKGSATSNLTLLGTNSIGTLNFTSGSENLGTLTIDRTSGVIGATLGSALTINNSLVLNNGLLDLAGSNLTMAETGTITTSPTNFIIADGLGELRKTFTANGSFVYPIGDRTGFEYSPVTLNFTAGTFPGYAGVKVTDSKLAANQATDNFITRYWVVSSNIASPTYDFSGTYISGASDVTGTDTLCDAGRWDGTSWTVGSTITPNNISLTGLTTMPATNQFTAGNPLAPNEIDLQGNSFSIANGDLTPTTTDHTDFGSVAFGGTITRTFTIRNTGGLVLLLSGTPKVALSGSSAFAVTTPPSAASILPRGTLTFVITYTASSYSAESAIVSISNNDSNENPYTFTITGVASSSSSDYFRSKTSGSWATASNWESSSDNSTWITSTLVPNNNAAAITILNTHNMTASSGSVTADDLTIDSGGTLTISGGTFTLNNGTATTDLQVNGALTYSGGTFTQGSSGIAFGVNSTYNHAIASATLTLPIATWNASSTCNVTGFNATSTTSGNSTLAQAFGNFTWNCAGQGASGYMNIQQSGFSAAGTLTVGPSANNLLSFGNSGGPYNITINAIVVSGGLLNCAGGANVNLTVTNDISVTGTDETNYGIFAVSGGSGTTTVDVGADLSISGSGYVIVLRTSSSPSATLRIRRDLLISGSLSPQINLEDTSSSGVATVTIDRDFICTSTTNPAVDFGTGAVTGNVINIGRNFSKSGNATFQTTSSTAATGFSFNGTGTQTFSYSGTNSNYISYIVQSGATLQLNSNLTLGTEISPSTWFTVASGGTLNFGTNSIIGNSNSRFITTAGATLIPSNTNGLGGTTASGSLQNFNSVGTGSAAGRAVFVDGTNYIFNGDTTTPFPNGTFGNPATVNINANVTSNMTSTLTVTSSFNVNNGGTFALNPTTNNLFLSGGAALNIASGGTFDNGGENIISGNSSPSITISGKFITRDADGFVENNSSIPSITPILNSGCTIEYGLAGNQAVQGLQAPDYQNITFSGGGTKTLVSSNSVVGTISILGATTFDAGNSTFGSSTSNVTMTGASIYKLHGTTQSKPESRGTYSLDPLSTFEFTGTSNTAIRVSSPTINYANIIISGTAINPATITGIKFQAGRTFTVKNGGVFKLNNTAGFTGSTTTAIDNTNAPTITLETGSTIEYAGTNQTLTPFTNTIVPTPTYTDATRSYSNLTISGSGTKTIASSSEILVGNELSVTGGTLQIDPNKLLIVNNAVKNTSGNAIVIKNSGNLVQLTNVDNDSGNTNTGNILMTRTSRNMQNVNDYVYWGSPVKGNVFSQIPSSVYSVSYQWDLTGAIDGTWNLLSSTTPSPGRGFISRVKTGGTGAQDFNFTGIPNNGTVSVFANGYTDTGADETGNTILLANPYPCAIDATAFVDANGLLDGNLYFWTSSTINTGAGYNYDDYATWNRSGSTGTAPTSNPLLNLKPTGKIAAGQGFFADFTGDGNVTFNNTMRVRTSTDNSQFFKTTKPNKGYEEKSRVWLNLTNSKKAFRQMLVAYITGATNGFDRSYDAESFTANEIDIYSIVEDKSLVIQGRALPFEDADTVPLGIYITNAGEYTIAIDEVDGLLTDKAIYIEDKLTHTVFDLKSGAYNFISGEGTFNERFILRYTDNTLGTTDFDSLENQVVVAHKNKEIKVNSKTEPIDKVVVFDLLGRQLLKKEKVNSTELTIANLVSSQQTLLVKVILQNGKEVTKKIIF